MHGVQDLSAHGFLDARACFYPRERDDRLLPSGNKGEILREEKCRDKIGIFPAAIKLILLLTGLQYIP